VVCLCRAMFLQSACSILGVEHSYGYHLYLVCRPIDCDLWGRLTLS
jgi:hypothetical protein